MKLHPLTMAVLLFSPAIAAHCRLGRTLSRITKTRSAITESLSASTKNQPPWLASSTSASASLASALLFFPRPDFPSALGPAS